MSFFGDIPRKGEKFAIWPRTASVCGKAGDIMHADTALAPIIGAIYEGIFDPPKWHTALRGLLDLCGGRAAFLAIVDETSNTVLASTVVGPQCTSMAAAMDLYRDEMVAFDPGFTGPRTASGLFRFSDCYQSLSTDPRAWADFIRHDFGSGDYHSYIRPAGGNLSVSLALHTAPDQLSLTAQQKRLHAVVVDHLSMAARMSAERPRLSHATEAMIMLDAQACLIEASPKAEKLLTDADGLSVCNNMVRTALAGEQEYFERLVRQACHPEDFPDAQRWAAVTRSDALKPWLLAFDPVPILSLGADGRGYLCRIEISGGRHKIAILPEQLGAMFGLTGREAEVVLLLARSADNLPAIAQSLGIAHETVRSHVRSAMAKLGTGSRMELVRLLSSYG